MRKLFACVVLSLLLITSSGYTQTASAPAQTGKSRLGLDEFFDFVHYSKIALSPDGKALVIATERPDWKQERYRTDLWMWREGMQSPHLLTASGHDSEPQWSPDGRWVAFLSDRKIEGEPEAEEEENVPKEPQPTRPQPPKGREADEKPEPVAHLYIISTTGGEALQVTRGIEEVHAFAWAPDSQSLYFATRTPWSKARRDAYKREWKDVIRFRESERGDVIARIPISSAIARDSALVQTDVKPKVAAKEVETAETPGSVVVANTPHRVRELVMSPNGQTLAFNTDSVSQRVEGVESYEIYTVPAAGGSLRQITRNQAIETNLHWSPDSRMVLFDVNMGSVEGKYEDVQTRLYATDMTGAAVRWASNFAGAITSWDVTPNGGVVTAARLGTEVPVYTAPGPGDNLRPSAGWKGTYEQVATALHSPRVAFVYSATDKPTEVYIAEDASKLEQAHPVTSFNAHYLNHELPQGKPYQWKADDGTTVEGMLIYPSGKMGAKNLRMFVLIHGGPADADGNKFGADWYDWALLAASNDWLVFRPNYRGSSGYGDKFMREIVPQLVSRPGKDILEGVDALVKEGIADPKRITIGGYSYGGYMTNWLITQSTIWKAAVSGAGAVEHAANWGNDDLTFDDAYYLGGAPWQVPTNYNSEAALFQFNKVKTPTHVVGGAADIRVSMAENYLLERALHAIGVPSSLLVFPGEGHPLAKNPWHGKIKVREELKWLEKYGGGQAIAPAQ